MLNSPKDKEPALSSGPKSAACALDPCRSLLGRLPILFWRVQTHNAGENHNLKRQPWKHLKNGFAMFFLKNLRKKVQFYQVLGSLCHAITGGRKDADKTTCVLSSKLSIRTFNIEHLFVNLAVLKIDQVLRTVYSTLYYVRANPVI